VKSSKKYLSMMLAFILIFASIITPLENIYADQISKCIEISNNTVETAGDKINTINQNPQINEATLDSSEESQSVTDAVYSYDEMEVPQNINAASDDVSIILTWDAVENASSYDVELDNETIESVLVNSFTYGNLSPNTQHVFRVRAVNQNGNSKWSEYVTKYTLLSTPANLKAALSNKKVTITWDAVSGATGYEIYRAAKKIGTTFEASYTDKAPKEGTEHLYTVKAFNDAGNISKESDSLTVTDTANSMMVSTLLVETISTSLTLSGDMTYGDLCLTGGTLNLNGYTLTVEGNLIQTGGTINVSNGTLDIKGDYRITSSDGSSYSTGYLKMFNEPDRVIVEGNFIMDSRYDHSSYLKAGVLEVKGDFTQRSRYPSSYSSNEYQNFYTSGTHKVLLSGSELQIVSLEDYSYSGFNELQVADTAFGVSFSTPVNASINNIERLYDNNWIKSLPVRLYSRSNALTEDLVIHADITLIGGSLNLGGKAVSVPDGLTFRIQGGDIYLNGGTLTINSSFTQTGGTMNVSNGTLNVKGDYNITSSDGTSYSSGYLNMTNGLGRVIVDGNFVMDSRRDHSLYLTAGILEVKGNFTQRSTYTSSTSCYYNFKASGTNKVLLSGSSVQTVSFSRPDYSGFNELVVADTAFGVSFPTPVQVSINCIDELYHNGKLKSLPVRLCGNGTVLSSDLILDLDISLVGGTLDLGGKVLSVADGVAFSVDGGTLNLNGGTLTTNNSFTQTGGTISLGGGTFDINNSFTQTGGTINVSNGTLNVKGDYNITSSDGASYSSGYLNMTNGLGRVIVDGNFVMDSRRDHSLYLTAGILEVKGNFTQRSTYTSSTSCYYNFKASGTNKVLLSGTSVQTISFEDYTYSRFNTLVITKPLDTGYTFNYQPVWITLMEISDDTEAPTTPSNLTVTSKSSSSVSLSWTRSTDNLTVNKYVILRDGIEIGESADTSFTDTGLSPNTTYTYMVKAYDGNNNSSGQSNIVSATTDGKPDWYYINTTDIDGNLLELYLSDIGGSAGESSETITAIVKGSVDTVWKEYELCGDIWTDNGNIYASAPGGGVVVTAISDLKGNSISTTSVSAMGLPKIFNIDLEAKKNEILDKIYDKIGIDPRELTAEDVKMLVLGVTYSVDDNATFNIVQCLHEVTTGKEPPEDNYYFARAKAFTDAMFVAAYTKATLGSAAAAVSALDSAGLSGGMALATSPSGAGTVVFGTAAVAELSGAAIMSGVSFVSSMFAEHSKDVFRSSVSNLQQTLGYKIRNVADNILDVMESAGGHTLEKHVSMTNNELISRAIDEGVDATSFSNKSTAITCVQQNLRKNADEITNWLKNSLNQNPLVVECNHLHEMGYGAQAGSQHITYGLTSSKVFMVKDSTLDLGFKIITSYPIF